MANTSVMIEYVEKLNKEEYDKFMDMIEKYDGELYWDILDYGILKYYDENVDLEEDYDVIKEMSKK